MVTNAGNMWHVCTIGSPLEEIIGSTKSRKRYKRSAEMKSMKNKRRRFGNTAHYLDGEARDKAVNCIDRREPELMIVTTRRCQCGRVRPIFGDVGAKLFVVRIAGSQIWSI